MSFLVANLPPVKCYVRKEFLYDFEKGHGELVPCRWVSLKSIKGQAFRIECYLPEYGAMYDKIPLHGYCWKEIEGEPLPLDHLQIWNCMSYDVTVIKKPLIENLSCKFFSKERKWITGQYMFTVDSASPDYNTLDVGFSEDVEDHKSFNFIKCDNGQFAAQPNNRTIIFEPSSNPKELKFPDFRVATKSWSVEANAKWSLGDTNTVMYEKEK
jgi:hypothetical protein